MRYPFMDARALAGALALSLVACRESAPDVPAPASESAPPATAEVPEPANSVPGDSGSAPAALVLQAAGYDTIRIGDPPSAAQGYALTDDGSYEDSCRIYSSDRLDNLYAIVEDGRIMRLTVFHRPGTGGEAIRTDRGVGPGSTEAEVRAAYSPLREQPHHYVEAPAKDLFFGGSEQAPSLRFEIGADGRVSHLHAGLEPVLSYVEACS
jgi:hypothetical protein